jgi:hypothetical protein
LHRAEDGESEFNYDAIYEGFTAMGIEEDDIIPRENIFTFKAWIAKGRIVKKGQHGVAVTTYIPMYKEDADGTEKTFRRPRTTTVFHISQTEELKK